MKFDGLIIPHKRGFIPRSLLRNIYKAFFWVHTLD
jgi:hypothetical protein